MKPRRPAQIEKLLEKIIECIERRKYRITRHAIQRQAQRSITLSDILYVLSHGFHEKKKTSFDTVFQTWKYSIRGKTKDEVAIRVIIAFSEEMMIVTVMKVER